MSRLTWLGHSTVVIELDGVRLLTDPVLRRRVMHLRRRTAVEPFAIGMLDAILVSHVHYDHLDLPSLARLDRSVPILVPRGAGELVQRRGFERVVELDVDVEVPVGRVRVRATSALHDGSRRPLGVKAPALGYVVEGSSRVYFAGDTDLFEGMAELRPLDLAVLPVSGWGPRLPAGHLDPESAAEALRLLRPKLAVPVHWGTYRTPFGPAPTDEPAREFARAAAERAPSVEVRVLPLGGSCAFGRAASPRSDDGTAAPTRFPRPR